MKGKITAIAATAVLTVGTILGTALASQATTTPVTASVTAVTSSSVTVDLTGRADLQVVTPAPLKQVYHLKNNAGKITVTGLAAGTAYEFRIAPIGRPWSLFQMFWTTAAAGKDGTSVSSLTEATATPVAANTMITTGGSAATVATDAGHVALPAAGTYLISVSAKVAAVASVTATVYPEFFVYDQAISPAFTGDLFNIGDGPLATGNASIDSYYSGTSLVTVPAGTTLRVYAFGYDGDHSGGSYTLENLTVSYIQVK
jgi:hypothetical protein